MNGTASGIWCSITSVSRITISKPSSKRFATSMPELPEVETTRRGIAPHLEGQRVSRVIVRDRRLRWPIPEDLDVRLSGQRIVTVDRRAKYLLINAEVGTLISHLGMSGNLRLVEVGMPAARH